MGHTPHRPPRRQATEQAPSPDSLRRYYERSSSALAGELAPLRFGEFLVLEGVIDRFQLLLALQMQDRHPGIRIGECLTALGFLGLGQVEQWFARFSAFAAAA